jgi:hypothetical protein
MKLVPFPALREIVDGLSAWVSSHRYVDPNKIKKKEQS